MDDSRTKRTTVKNRLLHPTVKGTAETIPAHQRTRRGSQPSVQKNTDHHSSAVLAIVGSFKERTPLRAKYGPQLGKRDVYIMTISIPKQIRNTPAGSGSYRLNQS